jgi:predicted 2-oxoglutarate/Fe(II)-dependent dioxygenase YbiX/peroxiredoxin
MAAGHCVVLCFYGAARDGRGREALAALGALAGAYEPAVLRVFGVTTDPDDAADPALRPGGCMFHFADFDGRACRMFGVAPRHGAFTLTSLRRCWFVLDMRLRVIGIFPLDAQGNAACLHFVHMAVESLGGHGHAPVVVIPNVFEPEFCRRLIRLHAASRKTDSAILTDGAAVTDHAFKRRSDCRIADAALAAQAQTRIFRRVVPEIRHVFQFEATKMERLIVACYDAEDDGRFGAHRDNTVRQTAHRRFAVSITLNDDFVGGELSFPEYDRRGLQPPAGGALVFSCSLLHAVAPVTQGRRYACLPFVYDDAAAALRRE